MCEFGYTKIFCRDAYLCLIGIWYADADSPATMLCSSALVELPAPMMRLFSGETVGMPAIDEDAAV